MSSEGETRRKDRQIEACLVARVSSLVEVNSGYLFHFKAGTPLFHLSKCLQNDCSDYLQSGDHTLSNKTSVQNPEMKKQTKKKQLNTPHEGHKGAETLQLKEKELDPNITCIPVNRPVI